MASIHEFSVEGITGKTINFADFTGKKILVVNVASECGYTPQYQQLEELYEAFKEKLVIIGFPSNDFGGQEPGSEEEILSFCTVKFGVTFPLAKKVAIKKAPIHPLYQWLTHKEYNGVLDSEVAWNFQKYLLDEEGQLIASHPSAVSPLDDLILNWIQS